ncbi:MAG TPA: transcriptional regulator [Spirochaetia bacterium]|nr:transcriptional regulator [Spirochaetales bacterium]HRS64385.1 transcriptional regulator [Spirochaetia bacterium]HOT58740.1 transcriptional regulator [Spirochaetales bacterium]HPD80627.1 transcriptional regulator [Spirochaetales bacterium]HQG40202.1 transcriptional regulator [Spirochaetales bacterium]
MSDDTGEIGFKPDAIDELLHNPLRLAIVTALSQVEQGDFNWLKELTRATDGNLATHLRKLEDSSYIKVTKTYSGRKPVTYYALTDTGSIALKNYIAMLASIVKKFETDPH